MKFSDIIGHEALKSRLRQQMSPMKARTPPRHKPHLKPHRKVPLNPRAKPTDNRLARPPASLPDQPLRLPPRRRP